MHEELRFIVRCKDCVYGRAADADQDVVICSNENIKQRGHDKDFFCPYCKPKEETADSVPVYSEAIAKHLSGMAFYVSYFLRGAAVGSMSPSNFYEGARRAVLEYLMSVASQAIEFPFGETAND